MNAPVDSSDAWMIYYARYKPAVGYPLVITTFTDTQCNKIQSPFYAALLPKLGFNRKTPRDIILYGPLKYGGMNMMDIKTEQLARHVHNHIIQLRKDDRVGKTIMACIDMYQGTLGTRTPFYTRNAFDFDYRPPRSMSVITYIWESLSRIGFTLHISNAWVPKQDHDNDTAIMDDMMEERKRRSGQTGTFQKYDLWMANACRLYLKISMLSDIIQPWVFSGDRQLDTTIKHPYQPRPPEKAWKACIYSMLTFLRL